MTIELSLGSIDAQSPAIGVTERDRLCTLRFLPEDVNRATKRCRWSAFASRVPIASRSPFEAKPKSSQAAGAASSCPIRCHTAAGGGDGDGVTAGDGAVDGSTDGVGAGEAVGATVGLGRSVATATL